MAARMKKEVAGMSTERAEILIVGGGIAGLSTASHLAQAGQKGIVILEREELLGFYASGHNAGIARQLTGRVEHTRLTMEGRDALAAAGFLETTGGYLLGAELGGTWALAQEAQELGLPVVQREGSPLPHARAVEHLHIPSDGVIDVDALLHHCAEEARARGAELRLGCMVTAIHPVGDGFEVETDQGVFLASQLVNAAGAWAQGVGRNAGGLDIPFRPLRRHLIWSNAAHPSREPWGWWADRPLYIRPESGGLLMCACEEEEIPLPRRGRQPEVDAHILENLFLSLKELAPSLSDCPIARYWAGLRTFAPDRRFVIGTDPVNPRLFWVAGLGGHGMTSGLAVGRLAAQAILGTNDPQILAPRRWAPAV